MYRECNIDKDAKSQKIAFKAMRQLNSGFYDSFFVDCFSQKYKGRLSIAEASTL
jgi:hypothetical protein